MNNKRNQEIKKSKNTFTNTMREEMQATALITENLSDSEADFISIIFCYPQLLSYIINIRNMVPGENYPTDADLAFRQYILDRKEQKYLPYPEIALLLKQLGFNMNDENTYYLAMCLEEVVWPHNKIFIPIKTAIIKKALDSYRSSKFHKPIWEEIIGDENLTNDEITFRIIDYIKNHPERFIDKELIGKERKLKPNN